MFTFFRLFILGLWSGSCFSALANGARFASSRGCPRGTLACGAASTTSSALASWGARARPALGGLIRVLKYLIGPNGDLRPIVQQHSYSATLVFVNYLARCKFIFLGYGHENVRSRSPRHAGTKIKIIQVNQKSKDANRFTKERRVLAKRKKCIIHSQ